MNDGEIWKAIAMGAMGLLELVIIGVVTSGVSKLDKRMDKQDNMINDIHREQQKTNITLTEHNQRLLHVENDFLVRYRQ